MESHRKGSIFTENGHKKPPPHSARKKGLFLASCLNAAAVTCFGLVDLCFGGLVDLFFGGLVDLFFSGLVPVDLLFGPRRMT